MNRIYRVVKNKKTGLWVVASEIARSASGGARTVLGVALLGIPLATGAQTPTVLAGGTSAPTVNTQAYTSGSVTTNPTVVNIVAPNSNGLSHNTYSRFNVGADGVVLNNVVSDASAETVVAGTVARNTNLSSAASVILNEVVSGGSASSLMGQMEVAGAKADVILANPYGITCDGCGFINVDRLTLTTGTPTVTNGSLASFAVNGDGTITVGSKGLNATGTTLLDLVARGITVNGPVNGSIASAAGTNGIRVVTGAGTWDYASGELTTTAGTGTKPTYAIDVAALGGMYAQTIKLVATEAGVGVRMLGNMAASTGDFILTSEGKIEVGGTATAGRDLAITTTASDSGTGTDAALYANAAVLKASRDIAVTAASGTLNSVGGQLTAAGNLTVIANKLVDASTAGVPPNNLRSANGNLSITVTDDSSLAGTDWQAGKAMSVSATGKAFSIDDKARVLATDQTTVSVGTLSNAGTLQLSSNTSAHDSVTATSLIDNSGTISSSGTAALTAGTLTNSGKVTGSGDLTVTADNLSMTEAAEIQGATSGTGTLKVTLANALTNPGKIDSGNDLSIGAASISNTGSITAQSDLALTATGAIENKVVLGASTAGRSLGIESVSNTEIIENNQLIAKAGTIDAGAAVSLSGASVLNESIINAGTTLDVAAASISNQVQGGDTRSSVLKFDHQNTGTIESWYEDRYFTGGRPANAPSMTAGTSVTFSNNTSAKNIGGSLTAPTLTLGSGFVDTPLTTTRVYQEIVTAPTPIPTPPSTPGELTVKVKDTPTTVELAPNGKVNVVNIAAPDRAGGLSRNTYTRFDVNPYGLILNNADSAKYLTVQTEQAGQILFNPNLPYAAGVILNEVFSLSSLYGFIEVAGTRADVVIANPYGITCGNCGFINVDRLTLATGTPTVANGSLSGIGITSGTITVQGSGLNALGANQTDLLARSISLDGPVNAHDLSMAAGVNTWNYANRVASAGGTPNGNAPAFSIYTSVPGGMYADTIRLVSTEAGAGVRLMGEAAASAGDFVLDSNGVVALSGKTSASRDLKVSTTSTATGSDFAKAALQINDAAVSAGRDVDIAASSGKVAIRGGQLYAAQDVKISATTLTDESTTHPQVSNNQRYAARDLSLTLLGNSGSGRLAGTNWQAADNLLVNASASGNAGSLLIDSSALLSAANGTTMQLATLDNYGKLQTSTGKDTASSLSVTKLTNRSGGKIASEGDITYNVSDTLLNDSTLQGQSNMTLNVGTLTLGDTSDQILGAQSGSGTLTIKVANDYSNIGLVHSGQDLRISAPGITNETTGGMVASRDMSLTANTSNINNYGAWYAGQDLKATATKGAISNNRTYHLVRGRFLGVDDSGTGVYEQNQVTDTRATIDAAGDLSLSAEQIVNSSLINVGGNAKFAALTILNQVQGGDTRVMTGNLDTAVARSTNWGYSFPDAYDAITTVTTWHVEQYFDGGKPDEQAKPQINAGNTLTWSGFTDAGNLGGLLQAPTINIDASGSATFTNDALATISEAWKWETLQKIKYIALGPLKYSDTTTGDYPTAPDSTTTSSSFGATVTANTLTITGPKVVNNGSPWASNPASVSVGGKPNALGFTISLPSNPNGYFVTNRDPSALFLIEANPKFNVGVSTLGSDYLASQLGLDVGTTQKRLGDASYEAYLVQQQLVQQTGAGLLSGFVNMAELMQGMFNNAAAEAGSLGLTYGQAPTAAQLANLSEPIVWMVETVVDGQKVLAPVVYLPENLKQEIDSKSAVLSAKDMTLNVASLSNTGGTLAGKDKLDITSKGDVENLSGSITGGNVSVTSTEGSIVNKTVSQGGGNELSYSTTIGKEASISSTGDLSLDAKKNIENIGAQMSAGGNATLNAGENIVFDTIEDKTTRSSVSTVSDGNASGLETSTTTTVNQIKSGLTVGGNLDAKAGKDITLAGTDVNVAGSGSLDAGGDLNILARENTVETNTSSSISGMGVGGGVYGTTETTTNSFSSRNVGTELNIGGDAKLAAGNTLTVQGSKLNVGGDTDISATDIKVLAGKDVDRTTTTTRTTSYLQAESVGDDADSSADSAEDSTDSGGEPESSAEGSRAEAKASVGTSAEGEANVSASKSAGLTLAKTKTTETSSLSQRSVGSELNLGGNVRINAKNKVTLQGSDLNAGGDLDLQAKNVELLAAQNIERTTSTTTTTRLGLYATTENEAGAGGSAGSGAEAGAEASAKRGGGQKNDAAASAAAGSQAGAEGQASASSKNTVDVMRVDSQSSESLNITNTGSNIRAGGNTRITAQEKLRLQGSSIESEGDIDLKAKDMTFEAAQDISYTKETSSTTRVGLYLDANANAEGKAGAESKASADAQAGNSGLAGSAQAGGSAEASAEAEGSAEAKIGAGIQVKVNTTTTESGSSTAVTSAIKSRSGSISRTAEGKILDVGTSIEAAGDFNQSANSIVSLAAENSQFSKTTTEETTARLGIYAEAGAKGEAGAKAGANAGASGGTGALDADAEAKAEAGASVEASAKQGIETTVDRTVDTETTEATQAVVSNIKVGGNFNSKSKEKTVLQGTSIDAGGDLNIAAKELEIQAARDTEKTTSSSESISTRLAVNVGVGAEAKAEASASSKDGASAEAKAEAGVNVGVEAKAEYEKTNSEQQSSTAVVANLSGGKKININTEGKTTMEGTNLNAGEGGVNIDAQSLDYKAAQDTYSSRESSTKVAVEAEGSISIIGNDNSMAAQADVGVASAQSSGSNAVVGSISSAGGLNIRTKDDTRLEGTQIDVAGDTNISAGGNVAFDAARNTYQASSESVDVGAGFDTGESSFNASVDVKTSRENSSEAVTGTLNTGGSLNISAGKNASFEGTQIAAGGDAQVVAGNNVEFKEARNTSFSESTSVAVEVGVGASEDTDDEGTTSKSKSFRADASVDYERSSSSEAVTGSIKAGNNLNVVAGNDVTFVGTEIGAGNGAAVSAGGDVNFKAAESSSEEIKVGVSAGFGAETTTETRAKPEADDEKDGAKDDAKQAAEKGKSPSGAGEKTDDAELSKTDSSAEAEVGVDFGMSSSQTQQGSKISAGAGGIQVNAGRNVNLQGTQMETDGAAEIDAGGSVNRTAAVSSSTSFGISAGVGVKNEKSVGTLDEPEKADDAAKAEGGDKADGGAKTDDSAKDAKPATKDGAAAQAGATDEKAGAQAEDGADGQWAKSEDQPDNQLGSLTLEASRTTTRTNIEAAGGTRIRSGAAPAQPIPGVSMTLRSTTQSDGTLKTLIPLPGNLPAGTKVNLTQPDGSALPSWVQFDAATGTISGTPPSDFEGGLSILVAVPQPDGTTRKIGVQFGS